MNRRMPAWLLLAAAPLLALAAAGSARQEFTQVLTLKPDEAAGRETFEACAACHGADGGGDTAGTVPRIAGQHYRVLVRQVIDFRQGRRWDMRMEGVATSHEIIPGLQDIANVAAYVSHLANDGNRGVGNGQDTGRGAAIYQKQCGSCHGEQAEGNDPRGVPRLAGQHAGYLARQIYDAVDGRRPELGKSHGGRFKPLDFQDVQGLTDYLARIGWQK
jgi:cytochrome c553